MSDSNFLAHDWCDDHEEDFYTTKLVLHVNERSQFSFSKFTPFPEKRALIDFTNWTQEGMQEDLSAHHFWLFFHQIVTLMRTTVEEFQT